MIAILMSTYNGERYVREQLDSILAQTAEDWFLLMRDDCSTDSTAAILSEYAQAHPAKMAVLDNRGENLGAKGSFEALLMHAPEEAEYYMFADQDDVWLPEKVAVTMAGMAEQERLHGKQTPVVVHTDLQVVDEDLKEMHPSFWQFSNIRPDLLDSNIHYLCMCNAVTGCAMMMNRAAREVSLPFAKQAYMHDQWIGAVVMKRGGVVHPIHRATMRYRQHRKNVVGAVSYRFTLGDWRNKWMLAKRAYTSAHPLVWRNWLHFVWWKSVYFVKLHTAKQEG